MTKWLSERFRLPRIPNYAHVGAPAVEAYVRELSRSVVLPLPLNKSGWVSE